MKTITHSGGITWDNATILQREAPIIKGFPLIKGLVKSVSLQTYFRISTTGNYSYSLYLLNIR